MNDEDIPKSMLQLQSYVRRMADDFTEMDKLLKIACILPISTAACERSFSTLQTDKSYLRSTMRNERLNDLMMLGIHRERASRLDLNKVVDVFSKKFPECTIQLY